MPDVTNYDGRLEQMAYYCEQMLDNIAKINNAYHDNVENNYVATLPNHLIKWKGIKQIGGKTIVWNQLVDSGTTTVNTISGRKYYTLINGTASIVTSDGTAITVVDDTADMVCDLTLMLGRGNEFATTDDFTEVFPATHYAYNAGTLLSAGVTGVVSKDSTDNTLQTYSIPASIQSLEGYGWSAGSVYNYIDYERKVFVQRVAKIVLDGTQTIASVNWRPTENGVGWIYPYSLTKNAYPASASAYANIVSDKFMRMTYGGLFDHIKGIGVFNGTSYGIIIWQNDTSLITLDAINTYLKANPITVYYELATPIEVDISEHLTDNNITIAESGGTITFTNQHGDDYRIPVPAKLEYIGL